MSLPAHSAPGPSPRWPAAAFWALTLASVIFAFVDPGRSNFWTDELFTVHLIHHDGGLGEVLRRALTDTHPPLYYFLLYGWSRIGGLGEAWLRLPSALCAVAALATTALALRRYFTPTAIAFALAAGSLSLFWFENAQNARSYALAMWCSAGLLGLTLALDRRRNDTRRWPWLLALATLGLFASLVHAYLLLVTGMVLAWLLLTQRGWRMRAGVILAGLVVLAVNLAYIRLLLHATTQDLHNLWFELGARFFRQQTTIALHDLLSKGSRIAVAALLLAWVWRSTRNGRAAAVPGHRRRAGLLAAWVLVGIIGAGIAISYAIAPSYSARNLLVAAPFAWLLLAWLYDVAGPADTGTRWRALAAGSLLVLVASNLPMLRGRALERNEAWRDSARFVAAMPGCMHQPIPVMLPYKFGPATPAYRELASRDFYGHYALPGTPISAWLPSELSGRHPQPTLSHLLATRAQNADQGGCTLLLWGVHDLSRDSALALAQELARAPGIAPHPVAVQTFLRARKRSIGWSPMEDGFVFYALPVAAAGTLRDPGARVRMPDDVLGDRYVITHVAALRVPGTPEYQLDGFTTTRFDRARGRIQERYELVPRTTCDPPMNAHSDIRPAPTSPDCFARPAATRFK